MRKTGRELFEDFKSLNNTEKKKFNELLVKELISELVSSKVNKKQSNENTIEINLSAPIHFKKKNGKYVLDGKYSKNIVDRVKKGFSENEVLRFWEEIKENVEEFEEQAYVLTLFDDTEVLLSKIISDATTGIEFLIVDIGPDGLVVPTWLSEDGGKIDVREITSEKNYVELKKISKIFDQRDFMIGAHRTFAIVDDSIYTIIF